MSYTINDIARELNISHSTVSRVLNNSDRVKPETRKMVLEKIEAMGYVPNLIARGLRTQNRMIAVVTQDILNPYYIESMYAIEKVCRENAFFLLHLNSDNQPELEEQNLYQLLSVKVQGVILLANMLSSDNKYINMCMDATNVVSIDGFLEGSDCVLSDSRTGIRLAVDHLLANGHTRIGMCHGECRSLPIQTRSAQFQQALQERGVPYDPRRTFFSDKDADFIQKLERARAAGELPTALFTLTDSAAINVYKWCAQTGLEIPYDLSIIGFDDITVSPLLSPPLTTIAQPIGRIAETAARLLIKQITGGTRGDGQAYYLPTEFIMRDSVANIRWKR